MMDGACDDLFAASGFAGDQDRRICFSDALSGLHETLHGAAVHKGWHAQQNQRVGIARQRTQLTSGALTTYMRRLAKSTNDSRLGGYVRSVRKVTRGY